jgi:exopolysaccharide biosynthesis polyprenyl glycosylphosphotransferase
MSHRRIDFAAVTLNVFQLFLDLAACASGFAVSFYLYKYTDWLDSLKGSVNAQHTPLGEDYYFIAAAFMAILLIIFTVKHLYQSRETGLMNMDEATNVLQGLLFTSAATICGTYVFVHLPTTRISRLILGLGVFLSCAGVLLGRAAAFKLRRYLQARGHFFKRVLICGAGESGRTIARRLLHSPKFQVLPVAFLDDDPACQNKSLECLSGHEPIPVAGRIAQIQETAKKYDAHEIWIAMSNVDQLIIIEIAQVAANAGLTCRFVPDLYQIPMERLSMDSLAGVPLLSLKPRKAIQPMPFTKRIFDIIFSIVVLLGSLVFWPLIILLIKLTSRGPVFFVQQRAGQGGRLFNMHKFRTMYVDSPAYAATPSHAHDRRITAVGRILRKLSIDELPQFWNVLIGDMSVVGPRPEMPQIVAQYTPFQRQRLSVKPGITGIWQISADRKNPIHENIDYDLYYIEKQSFSLDLMIILTTGFYGARGI